MGRADPGDRPPYLLLSPRKDILMTKIAIVYHSGYGHTAKVAEHVRKGATTTGTEVTLYKA